MTKHSKISIEFGVPVHGWLPTTLRYEDFKWEQEISNAPLDPMEQLLDALIQLCKGINKPRIIIWHLEPYCYYLQLEITNGIYKAILLESDELESPTTITRSFEGRFETIVLPLYRGLKQFWSQSFQPPHWDELDQDRMEELTALIKKRKAL